jgi:hypothetical protein
MAPEIDKCTGESSDAEGEFILTMEQGLAASQRLCRRTRVGDNLLGVNERG